MRKFLLGIATLASVTAHDLVFQDPFTDQLKPGWSWVREERSAWRIRDGALEIRIQPGNMWGPENSGKNVLVRTLPAFAKDEITVSMTVQNSPTHQYEQTDLVCYFDDSHMVKIGQELVDGKLSIVMGREEQDKTRTLAIVPLEKTRVELRLIFQGNEVSGQFRPDGTEEWQAAGKCDLPASGQPRIAIQCYQGSAEDEHWSRIQNFRVERASK